MKKLLLLSLSFIVYCSSSALAAEFPDIKSPILLEAVNYLNEQGIIKGYPDGTFKPDQVINRAEALKIIFLSLNKEEALRIENSKIENSPFPDVEKTQWFTPFVQEAKNRGMVSGYADGTYKPTQFVNKAEFIKIAMLAQSYYSQPSTINYELPFTDLDPSAWYIPYLGFALSNEFVDRVSKFNPTAGMSRGEAALIIYRVAKYNEGLVEEEPEPLPYLSCETCVNGVDLSQYEWSTLPFVKIEGGKVFVDGNDKSYAVSIKVGDENIISWIELAKLKYTPLEEKQKIDQLYPDLYKRAIILRGGIQDKDEYLDWPPINKRIVTKNGTIIYECDECRFEQAIINQYQQRGYPPFESWIGTDDAKPFIYDTIQGWLEDHPEDAH